MTTQILRRGVKVALEVYIDRRGFCPVREFVDGLPDSEQAKLFRLLERIAKEGIPGNLEHFRPEGKGIYAIKSGRARILCFYRPGASQRTLILTHGYPKQKGRMPRREKERALMIMNLIFTEEG